VMCRWRVNLSGFEWARVCVSMAFWTVAWMVEYWRLVPVMEPRMDL